MTQILMLALATVIIVLLVVAIRRGRAASQKKQQTREAILRNPVETEAELIKVVAHAPSPLGVVNLIFDYRYLLPSGDIIEVNNVLTAVKTPEMQRFQPGTNVTVIYNRLQPHNSMLKMENAAEVLLREKLAQRKAR